MSNTVAAEGLTLRELVLELRQEVKAMRESQEAMRDEYQQRGERIAALEIKQEHLRNVIGVGFVVLFSLIASTLGLAYVIFQSALRIP